MHYVIDIGNTRTKIALFENDEVLNSYVANGVIPSLDQSEKCDCIVSSTAGDIPNLNNTFKSVLELSSSTALPIANNYATPETLGKDRIALAVGGNALYPNQNVLVIDMGTCVTMDLVTEDNTYQGGYILPGAEMSFKAMHQFTGKLPLVNLNEGPQKEYESIGKSTLSSMQNGVEMSLIWQIEGAIAHFRNNLKNLNVILTGGDAPHFETKLKSEIFVHPNLVLFGLNKILTYNVCKE